MRNKTLKLSKTLSLLLGVYLTLLFAVVMPFHRHADNRVHSDDCTICAMSVQPVIANAIFNANIFHMYFVILLLAFSSIVKKTCFEENLHLHGPPVV